MRSFGTKNHALWSTQKKERTFGVIEDLQDSRIPKFHEDVLVRSENFGFVIFNPKTDTVLQTNLTGAEIFRHCNGRRSISEISKSITDVFQTGEEIVHRDVKAFLLELVELNLIEYV